jgi:hypothetical protein
VWENPNENLAFPFQETVDGDTAGFNLTIRHPAAVKGLETEVAEGNGGSRSSISGA